MNEELRDLAAIRALNGLAPEEAAQLDEEAARDPALAADVEEYRSAVAMLESAVARERAPHDLFERVLARIAHERVPAPAEAPTSRAKRFTWRPRILVPSFAAGVAAAAAVVVIAVALSSSGSLGTQDALASVQGTAEFTGVHGEARLYGSTDDDGRLMLELADVPALGTGEHYEVWVLRDSPGEAMEAVGVFRPTASDVKLELRLPGPGAYQAVDVSLEPDGGSAEHSGRSLAGGRFESPSTSPRA
ncbi:MAG: anti-sigma factor [Thermoleophilia bacterium]|nr:anti-sigma factor [Thermoleophilia bacterium]MDH4339395.1 anti-sigma factor [Thermoleophilia bacterium]MDH5280645.1 anti-sigma factor [Thermoleophilia bacterium]